MRPTNKVHVCACAQAHEAAMAADWREYQALYKEALAMEQARPSRPSARPRSLPGQALCLTCPDSRRAAYYV